MSAYPAVAARISNGRANVPQTRMVKKRKRKAVIAPSFLNISWTTASVQRGAISITKAVRKMATVAITSTCSSFPITVVWIPPSNCGCFWARSPHKPFVGARKYCSKVWRKADLGELAEVIRSSALINSASLGCMGFLLFSSQRLTFRRFNFGAGGLSFSVRKLTKRPSIQDRRLAQKDSGPSGCCLGDLTYHTAPA